MQIDGEYRTLIVFHPSMEAAACTPPKQEMAASNDRIPLDILEEIFLNLPVKSLVRFCCVSSDWQSKISESSFIRKYRSRASLLQKRVFINDYPSYFDIETAFSCPLSSISNQPIDHTMSLFSPFRADVKLKAFCEELWCVDVKKSLYLWNPSMGKYRKLPDPPSVSSPPRYIFSPQFSVETVYGIGYDPVNDDYKVLKVWGVHRYFQGTLLYSLRSDSWREIYHSLPRKPIIPQSNGEFVNGAFHWMVLNHGHGYGYGYGYGYDHDPVRLSAIIAFDLSTERYKEVPQPMYSPGPNSRDSMEVTVLREMLCVFLNYRDTAFVLWVMKDYGVEESWTKMYDIRYSSIPSIPQKIRTGKLITLKPLYLYENGEVLIWLCAGYKDWEIVICKDEQVIVQQEIVARRSKTIPVAQGRSRVRGGFVYVDSLISPATWPEDGG